MRKMMITAHSGCEGTPDNSMESILRGVELGADCVEIDIRMDEKGGMWLTHDAAADYASAVPLEEALRTIAAGGAAVNCDLKEERAFLPTLEMAEACGIPRDKLIFSGSVDVNALAEQPEIARRARIFLNSEELCRYMAEVFPETREAQTAYIMENLTEAAALMKKLGVEALNAPYKYLTDDEMARLRAAGVQLSLWTVNDETDQAWLMKADLVNMTTRSVVSAMNARSKG